ncbi:hypothetical protein SDRG_13662 [Saprolegnia diclina VS20]|uniref:Helicase-associated domain-containing protein n=1 Tax=Saprolegnia diclina (strain VS20) TaxID=1156394 RepID=T0Q215_SAPDV|nr:hypothetical protein SDRG_13662 [Saprolegnia diclina VS20]EQC28586.1 hypothetical protein SDRG_13662 [Saprolegnia diclina VS20]|eukprot:XP_008617983.1 hypothetical protein SDRG_13662 [Saprolegnia diclina VS20]
MLLRRLQRGLAGAGFATKAIDVLTPKMRRKIESFVEIVRVKRVEQAATSDYTIVPTTMRIPNAEPWPADFRGKFFPFTDIRKLHRDGLLPPDVEAELEAMRFVWDVNTLKWQLKIDALTVYKSIYGDTYVPYKFVCPAEDPWPRDTWHAPLGKQVSNILKDFHSSRRVRTQVFNNPTPRQAQLIALDFDWEGSGYS